MTLEILNRLFSSIPQASGVNASALLAERQRERAQHIQFVRSIAASYVDLYQRAPSLAYKEHYQRILQDVTKGLPQADLDAMRPLLSGTPLDPAVQKEAIFEREFGPRPVPQANYKDNPVLYAQTLFEQQEYDARKKHFMTGESGVLKRIIGLPDGQFAVKDGDGPVAIFTADDLKAEGEAAKWGTSLKDLLLNDGIVRGTPYREVLGGVEYEVIPRRDIIKGKNIAPIRQKTTAQLGWEQQLARKHSGLASQRKPTADQLKIFDAFAAGDKENPLYDLFQKRVLDTGELTPQRFADVFLQKHFPGQVVLLKDVEKDKSWIEEIFGGNPFANYIEGPEFSILSIWGEKALTNKGKRIIFDRDTTLFYDKNGKLIEDPQTFIQQEGGFALGGW